MRTVERYGNIIRPVVDMPTGLKLANWEMQSTRLLDPANPAVGLYNCHQTRRAKDTGGRTNGPSSVQSISYTQEVGAS